MPVKIAVVLLDATSAMHLSSDRSSLVLLIL